MLASLAAWSAGCAADMWSTKRRIARTRKDIERSFTFRWLIKRYARRRHGFLKSAAAQVFLVETPLLIFVFLLFARAFSPVSIGALAGASAALLVFSFGHFLALFRNLNAVAKRVVWA
jgi:hypothetical protein